MGLNATRMEPWLLVSNDVKLRQEKRVETDALERVTRGWLEQADHGVIQQRRHFVGLIGFDPDAGEERHSFSWYVGGGRTLGFSRMGRAGTEYVCSSDRIEITDVVTGSGWQTQVWELVSKFDVVPGSYYEESIDVEESEASA